MRIRWRGLELPSRVQRDEAVSTHKYGCFVVEPFERGFGTTVGNGLRRILLSSLEGAAVTHVRIQGADHEFTTIPNVLEDVTVIILNVKGLIIRCRSDEPKTMRVHVKGRKNEMVEVRAGDIEADPAITIINPEQVFATLTDEVEFDMEMTVGTGRSYKTAEEHKSPDEEQIIGVIPVDSVFSPVVRVRYRVEDTRVGQRTNYDRLVLEIWTNGTITPEMALVEAAKILRKHLNPFVQYFELGGGLAVGATSSEEGAAGPADETMLSIPISDLELSVRAANCLESAKILTVGDLIRCTEPHLLELRSFGKTSLREVKRKLADLGMSLGVAVETALEPADDTSPASETPPVGEVAPPPADTQASGASVGTISPVGFPTPPSTATPTPNAAPSSN